MPEKHIPWGNHVHAVGAVLERRAGDQTAGPVVPPAGLISHSPLGMRRPPGLAQSEVGARFRDDPHLGRKVSAREYELACGALDAAGLREGWVQELEEDEIFLEQGGTGE